jgi:hypothetical protein
VPVKRTGAEQEEPTMGTQQLNDVTITGDWFLIPGSDRYSVAYLAKEDPEPAARAAALRIFGYPGDFYAGPAVVEHLVADVARMNAELVARHQAEDAPRLSWDGQTLTIEEAGEVERNQLRPDGLVRLPAWTWGPVSLDEVDRVIGPIRPDADGSVIGWEARCTSCGATYNPTGEEDGYADGAPEHYTKHDGTECGGRGEIVGSWS